MPDGSSFTCVDCLEVIEYPAGADLYDVTREHATKCPAVSNRLPAVFEASTGAIAPAKLRAAAIIYARQVNLVPELGHVVLYHGKPWVTINGWFYRFRQKYPRGYVFTRPLTQQERDDMGLDPDIMAWQAEVRVTPKGDVLAIGYGYARPGDDPLAYKSSVEPRWPWRLAEKRAEEDALRKAVPLDLDSNAVSRASKVTSG